MTIGNSAADVRMIGQMFLAIAPDRRVSIILKESITKLLESGEQGIGDNLNKHLRQALSTT